MPLDGHAHLVSQGWSGKGNGLRRGAIAKPITVLQKKTLSGIGKDRDEAFPFWDHVFQASAVSIQIKVHNSDDESDADDTGNSGASTPAPGASALRRTQTGILSNRRPLARTPADSSSGTSTPSAAPAGAHRRSVLGAAKQQAARRLLYSMFYRGPVLTNEGEEKEGGRQSEEGASGEPVAGPSAVAPAASEADGKKNRKRKAGGESEEDRAERKRQRRAAKEQEKRTGDQKKRERAEAMGKGKGGPPTTARKAERAERKRLRAERRVSKEARRKRRADKLARKAGGSET
ncbi:uncharacterized protein BXZ73DRAFT_21435, partial [Epithele typhae]|uniref:uncharacterized protein n=1 Tax=Epithele typhae TaxID=378194 RepID=UPI0020080974